MKQFVLDEIVDDREYLVGVAPPLVPGHVDGRGAVGKLIAIEGDDVIVKITDDLFREWMEKTFVIEQR